MSPTIGFTDTTPGEAHTSPGTSELDTHIGHALPELRSKCPDWTENKALTRTDMPAPPETMPAASCAAGAANALSLIISFYDNKTCAEWRFEPV
jgi:hypothetical protein